MGRCFVCVFVFLLLTSYHLLFFVYTSVLISTVGAELWEVHEIFRKTFLCGLIVYFQPEQKPGKFSRLNI